MVAEIWASVISPFVDQWVALNKFSSLDPDPDHLRGGLSHGIITSSVKTSNPLPVRMLGLPL